MELDARRASPSPPARSKSCRPTRSSWRSARAPTSDPAGHHARDRDRRRARRGRSRHDDGAPRRLCRWRRGGRRADRSPMPSGTASRRPGPSTPSLRPRRRAPAGPPPRWPGPSTSTPGITPTRHMLCALASTRPGAPRPSTRSCGGLDESTALFEARRCMSCGNCFQCDNCFGVCPDNAVDQGRRGPRLPLRLRLLQGVRAVRRGVPLRGHRDGARGDLGRRPGAGGRGLRCRHRRTGRRDGGVPPAAESTHGRAPPPRAACADSAAATVARTASTASGFTEIEVMPCRTRCSAKAGRFDGACPHSDDVIPAAWQPSMMRPMVSSTAGSASSKTSAQISESRSTPSTSWVRSLLPIETPAMPIRGVGRDPVRDRRDLRHHPHRQCTRHRAGVDHLEAGLELPSRAHEGDHEHDVGRLLEHPGQHVELEAEEVGLPHVAVTAAVPDHRVLLVRLVLARRR